MTITLDYDYYKGSASLAAADVLSGNVRVLHVPTKIKIVEKKISIKKIFFSTILICLILYFSWPGVSGSAVLSGFAVGDKQGEILKNSSITFFNIKNKKEYCAFTNREGDFCIRVPKGKYKVYGSGKDILDKYKNPQSSILNLNITSSSKLRITIKK